MIRPPRSGDVELAEGRAALARLREQARVSGLDRLSLQQINAVIEVVRGSARPRPHAEGR